MIQTDISAESEIIEIIPSPGVHPDFESYEKRIEQVKGFAKTIHIDIVDGKFAENKSFMDPAPFAKYAKEVFLEVHLMVDDPMQYLKPFVDAGFKRIIGQIEKMPNQAEFVAEGQLLAEVGLAIDGPTDMSELQVPVDDLDCLLFMTVKAGIHGQEFNHEFAQKLEMLKDTTWIPLEVDGGINEQALVQVRDLGATRFVSTGFLFKGDPKIQYKKLQELLKNTPSEPQESGSPTE